MKEAPILVLICVLIVGGIGIWVAIGSSLPFSNAQPAVVQPASDGQPDDAQPGWDPKSRGS